MRHVPAGMDMPAHWRRYANPVGISAGHRKGREIMRKNIGKRFIAYLCAGAVALSLAACGNGDKAENGSAAGSQTENGSAAGGGAGTGGQAGAGTGGQAGAGTGGQAGAGSAAGDQAQSGTAAGNSHNYEEGWTEELEGVKAAILNAVGDNYFPNMALMPDMLEEQFGITADMYDDYLAEMPMISTNVDTLLIIRAKDDKVKEVEDALDAYRDARINDSMQYPMNVGVVQASRIERIGNYVCFVQLGGDVMEAMESGDEAVILQCQELNELVIEIISQKVG